MAQRRQQQQPASPDLAKATPGVEPLEEVVAVDDDLDDDDDGAFDGPVGRSPQPFANGEVTNTSNFFGSAPDERPEPQSMVLDKGIEVADAQPTSNIVRVVEDIGPIFLGRKRPIELKKGVAYRVDDDIYDYLQNRNMIYGA